MRWVRSIALVALVAAGLHALPDEQRHVALVPWKVLEPGETAKAPLTLFWIPDSASAMRRSPLLTSDDLTLYSSRCVAMRVVRFDDQERLVTLAGDAELPLVVLADQDGRVIGSVRGKHGRLSVTAVEDLVAEELEERTSNADELLEQARRRAEDGDVDGATALYQKVWEARCLCPRQGKMAMRALRRLEKR